MKTKTPIPRVNKARRFDPASILERVAGSSEEIQESIANEIRRRNLLRFVSDSTVGYSAGWLHRHICEKLEQFSRDVVDKKSPRLMLFVPPRHGKSFIASERFPCWHLGRNPTHEIIEVSWGMDLAETFSRKAMGIVESDYFKGVFPKVRIVKRSVRNWTVAEIDESTRLAPILGGYRPAGVGGGIYGHGAHILVIDDPVKGYKEAQSQSERNSTFEWYRNQAYSRVAPGGGILLIMTRWHEDDLAGRLLEAMEEGGERWDVIKYPAIAESDEEFRKKGEPLHPERWPLEALNRIRKQGERMFAALYQQRPAPLEGNLFPVDRIQIVRPQDLHHVYQKRLQTVRYWDNAGSRDSGCYTAGAKMSRLADGRFLIEHMERFQLAAVEREQRKLRTAQIDGHTCEIWIEQEPGSSGKDVGEATVRMLAGFIAKLDRVSGDKVFRAEPLAAQVQAGNVLMMEGPWNRDLLEELAVWPHGKYLDQGDALAGAFAKVSGDSYDLAGMSKL